MNYLHIIIILSLVFVSRINAQELKDPRLRDEDISATQVLVDVQQQSDGLYRYRYSVESPISNKGKILSFSVDLSCDVAFEPVDLPYPVGREGYTDPKSLADNSLDVGMHTPSAVSADYGNASSYGVSLESKANWLISLEPDGMRTGLQIVSPVEPGLREYTLIPSMYTVIGGWDYPSFEGDPSVPWIPDFTVTGMIPGPGCPGVTPPIGDDYFPGTEREPAEVNKLLTYSTPQQDRWHVEADVNEVEIKIHYSDDIDPKTFKVQPGWARSQFKPVPGGTDTVVLPLKQAVNKFNFEVATSKSRGPKKENELHHSLHDRDVFEIRRDVVKKGNQGANKGKK